MDTEIARMAGSSRAPGLVMPEGMELPDDLELGVNVVIHPGVVFGSGVVVEDGAVLGKPTRLNPRSRSAVPPPGPLVIGDRATIGTYAVLQLGSTLGEGCYVGVHAWLRDGSAFGSECVIGRGAVVGRGATVGDRFRLETNGILISGALVEDDVFMGPGVAMTNDNAAGRRSDSASAMRSPVFRSRCRVGSGALFLPGVEVGEDAFVAVGAVVTHDVPPGMLVQGVPAKVVGPAPYTGS